MGLARLRAAAAHPTTLLVVGAVTFIVALLVITGWIAMHREAWEAGRDRASFSRSNGTRALLSLVAGTSVVTLTVSTLWLGFARRWRSALVAVFWLAAVALWLVALPIVTTGLDVDVLFELDSGPP